MNTIIRRSAQGAAGVLGCLLNATYLGMGLVQLLAIYGGMKHGFDLPWFIAGPISLILAYIPVVGSSFGVWAAMRIWGWEFWPAFALFFWQFGLFAIALAIAGSAALFDKSKD